MQKIPGKQIAKQILADCKQEVKEKALRPKLGVILVGDDPASHLYVSLKERAAQDVGVATDVRRLPAGTSDEEIINIINDWNEDPALTGILIQVPLPEGHDTEKIIASMDPKKDADGFHPKNIEALMTGDAAILSPLHEGILRLIAHTPITPNHAYAIILANSHTFADPLKKLLEKAGADVDVMLAKEKDDKQLREADIVVSAIGKPGIVNGNSVRDGSCVIDVGITKTADGKVKGDFDETGTDALEGWYSPVPGGVGPMTVSLLINNVVNLCKNKKES
ncbi:MAG: bifunctional 5,10-methylenetetrahydrofolate dehydrogenase/5,10-methenyltetrahydrofolate cyclohydrolase [Patescibacteria group bacterium]